MSYNIQHKKGKEKEQEEDEEEKGEEVDEETKRRIDLRTRICGQIPSNRLNRMLSDKTTLNQFSPR